MKKRLLAFLLTFALTLSMFALGSTTAQAKSKDDDFIKDIPYIDDGNKFHMMNLHGTDDSGEKKPVIVEVHGGSYIGGVKDINTKHSRYYAEHGFAVVNTNYTTMSNGGFDNVVQDLNAVLLWIDTHAEEYGLDREHVFMSGDSAGGYFVTLMAAVLNSKDLQDYYQISVPSFKVKGFILTCPGSDIPALAAKLNVDDGSTSASIANRIGEAVLGNEDIVNHADLFSIIHADEFPEVYILTTPDDDVLYTESLKLHEFLTGLGIEHVYQEYYSEENHLEHVFNIGHVDWAESIKANDDIIAYLKSKCPEMGDSTSMIPVPLKTVEASPEDADYYEKVIETELYNLRVIRNIPSAYEKEGYEAYLSASNMLGDMDPAKLSDGQKGTLDKVVALHKDLVQVKSYADVVWQIWGESIPCKENPNELVFTSKSYDNADMKPYIVPYLLDDQSSVKGNLIIVAGGGYSSRNNKGEGFPIAAAFNEKGYNCFLLQRRVEPYCVEDIWMDMQRSIRYVRYYGEKLGFGAMNNLLAAGFSGGSATVLGAIENLYGDIQPTIYDPTYVPDEIDAVNSDLDIAFLLYGPNPAPVHEGVYEGLVTENEKIPELFIAAGADDPTGAPEDNWVLYQTAREKTNAELHTFANVGHGFGVGYKKTNSTFWIDMADNFVTQSLAAREKAAKKNK